MKYAVKLTTNGIGRSDSAQQHHRDVRPEEHHLGRERGDHHRGQSLGTLPEGPSSNLPGARPRPAAARAFPHSSSATIAGPATAVATSQEADAAPDHPAHRPASPVPHRLRQLVEADDDARAADQRAETRATCRARNRARTPRPRATELPRSACSLRKPPGPPCGCSPEYRVERRDRQRSQGLTAIVVLRHFSEPRVVPWPGHETPSPSEAAGV